MCPFVDDHYQVRVLHARFKESANPSASSHSSNLKFTRSGSRSVPSLDQSSSPCRKHYKLNEGGSCLLNLDGSCLYQFSHIFYSQKIQIEREISKRALLT